MIHREIVISYCIRDQKWVDYLKTRLEKINRRVNISLLMDNTPAIEEITDRQFNINKPTVFFPMISVDFLTSTLINKYVIPPLLELSGNPGIMIIPVIVRPCAWKWVQWLSRFKIANPGNIPLSSSSQKEIDQFLNNLATQVEDFFKETNSITSASQEKNFPGTILLTKFPPAPIKLIGRETELKELETLLTDNKAVVLVNGIGGIGKTEVCRKFFHDYYDRFAYAAWVDYHSSLKESFFSAIKADILGENRGENMEERFQKIIDFLQSQPGQVFIVVDHIDNDQDPDLLELTALRNPVLVNSRQLLEVFQSYSLDGLDVNRCKELFYRFYQLEKNDEIVASLIGLCGNHTLTVELLARVGQQAGSKLEDLLEELSTNGLGLGIPGEEEVRTFWHSQAGEKRLLAHLIGVFDLSQIAEEEMGILINLSILPAIYIEQENIRKWLMLKSGTGIERLVKRGWLIRRGSQVFMHPVVQEVVRDKQQPRVAKCRTLIMSLRTLLNVYPNENPFDKKWLLEYVESVLGHLDENDALLAFLVNHLSCIYINFGELRRALLLQERALAIREKILEKDHPDLATSFNNLSLIYQALGDLERALELQRTSLFIREKIMRNNHPLLADSYCNLSSIYHSLGQLDNALEYVEKGLAIREKTLEKDHPLMATTYSDLAMIYKDMGKLDKAFPFQEQAHAINIKTLGKDHPNLAFSYNNLAILYQDRGEVDKALAFQEQALAIREKILGKDHPHLATSYNNISLIYRDLKNYPLALSYNQKALTILQKIFPNGHPDLNKVKRNLEGIEKIAANAQEKKD